MAGVNDLVDELTAELSAANFSSYSDAVTAINYNNGIRARYLSRADQFWARGEISERLHSDIGRSISLSCDRCIARLAPTQCSTTGWTSHPISSLTEDLK